MKLRLFSLAIIALLYSVSASAQDKILKLATTTSTENSGLLGVLLPEFEQSTGYKVHVIAVGTGKALRMGRDGDVDVVLVHAPKAEQDFVASGHGVKRFPVMHNDFVVVGPQNDPAGLSTSKHLKQAFSRLEKSQQTFVSRGDKSGTHKKELTLWQAANIQPQGRWYREAGQGMGKVLQMAGELEGYTLTDRGTWIAYQDKSPLKIVFQGDESLHNPYSIIAVNPEKHDVNNAGANSLIHWITSQTGKQHIAAFRLHGEQLFYPAHDMQEAVGTK